MQTWKAEPVWELLYHQYFIDDLWHKKCLGRLVLAKSIFSLQIGLCGAAISCWLRETRQSASLSFSLTPWKWSRGIWPWLNLCIRPKNTGQSRKPAAVLGGRTVAGFARCARQAEKEDRGTWKWQKLLQFIHSGFSFGQHWSTSLKEAALRLLWLAFVKKRLIGKPGGQLQEWLQLSRED